MVINKTATAVAICIILLFVVILPVMATDGMIFLPVVQKTGSENIPTPISTPPPGSRAPISAQDCMDIENSPSPNYPRLSARRWPNGTTFMTILTEYRMEPTDFGFLNYRFFADGVINVYDGTSDPSTGVCLPHVYRRVYARYGDDNFSLRPQIEFNDNRPDWPEIIGEATIASSPQITDTYVFLGIAIAEDTWYGAPIVGTLKVGDSVFGQIARVTGINRIGGLLGKAIGPAVGLAAIYERIDEATTNGVEIPATDLGEGAGIVYFRRATDIAYLDYDPDSIIRSDQLYTLGGLQRLYMSGVGNQGFVVTSTPSGGSGDTAYPWAVVTFAAKIAVAEKTNSDQEMAEILSAVEQFLANTDNDPDNDVDTTQIVPPPPESECPKISTGRLNLLRAEILIDTQQAFEQLVADPTFSRIRLADLYDFVDAAFHYAQLPMTDRYQSRRPRAGSGPHFGHLTSEPLDPDDEGSDWTYEAACVWTANPATQTAKYTWWPRNVGRMGTGLTRSDEMDWIPAYPYGYFDTGPTK